LIAPFRDKNLSSEWGSKIGGQPYHIRPWDEVLGPALEVEELEGHCLALIGKISILLPLEMSTRLAEAKGQRVGILRTDNDYRFRVIQGGH
jgi:hypothetical protein